MRFSRHPVGVYTTERVVEVPWVLSRYRGERRILDVGHANAPRVYAAALWCLRWPGLFGVDVVAGRRPHRSTVADVRRLPFRSRAFDLTMCISTLEHIGLDNRVYGWLNESSPADATTLAEIRRVTVPGGRILVTVPFGRRQDHGWFIQYDLGSWSELIETIGLEVEEQAAFRLGPDGWQSAAADSLGDLEYGDGVPAARAVLCAALVRPG